MSSPNSPKTSMAPEVVLSSGMAGGLGSCPSDTGVSSSGVVWRELKEGEYTEYAATSCVSVGVVGTQEAGKVDKPQSVRKDEPKVTYDVVGMRDAEVSKAETEITELPEAATGCVTLPGVSLGLGD